MTSAAERMVKPATVVELFKIGFKVVPLRNDAKTPVISWSSIYENSWDMEELAKRLFGFYNVATCFGKTHFKDEHGTNLFLNCLDIDSQDVFRILVNLADPDNGARYSLIDKSREMTFVTKTKKSFGYHIYWFSHEPNPPIKVKDCIYGKEFEIKTDKTSGLCSLPPSRHREYPDFEYQNIGQNKIMVADGLYNSLIKLLSDCLKPKTSQKGSQLNSLSTNEVGLTDPDIDTICELLKEHYKQCYRNVICLYLAGFLLKNDVTLESAKELFLRLTKEDEEKQSRFIALEETYKKQKQVVMGYKGLVSIISGIAGESTARKIIQTTYSRILSHKSLVDNNDLAFELAETIKKEYVFRTMNDTREIYYYQDGKYLSNGERIIEIESPKLWARARTAVVNEVIEMIRRT